MISVVGVMPTRHDKREFRRERVTLPALIATSFGVHGIKVIDLTTEGAMIEGIAALCGLGPVIFRCGNIDIEARVIWQANGRAGLKFLSSVERRSVDGEIRRSAALLQRFSAKSKSSCEKHSAAA